MRKSALLLLSINLLCACNNADKKNDKKLAIVYSKKYNIRFFGLQKKHSFETEKYGKVYKSLKEELGLSKDNFYKAKKVSKKDLLLVHTEGYLNSLKKSKNVAKVAELDILRKAPNFLLQSKLIKPVKYATGGTILGAKLALEYGWSINLSGGYHHAKNNEGSGFCFFADIPIAIKKLLKENEKLKILIIDLDAHRGNGLASVLKDNKNVEIFDIYNKEIYPRNDLELIKDIDYNFPVKTNIEDKEYIEIIEKELPIAIERSMADLIIYNAGTDIYEKDPLGEMKISKQGIIHRDELVFRSAIDKKIPILMVLSGGYTKQSSKIVSESISNILIKIIGMK